MKTIKAKNIMNKQETYEFQYNETDNYGTLLFENNNNNITSEKFYIKTFSENYLITEINSDNIYLKINFFNDEFLLYENNILVENIKSISKLMKTKSNLKDIKHQLIGLNCNDEIFQLYELQTLPETNPKIWIGYSENFNFTIIADKKDNLKILEIK